MRKKYGTDSTKLELSNKARIVYAGTDPLDIYEIETEDGLHYCIKDCDGTHDGLTAEQVNAFLEEIFEITADDTDEDEY